MGRVEESQSQFQSLSLSSSEMASLKVAVRVRPFNQRFDIQRHYLTSLLTHSKFSHRQHLTFELLTILFRLIITDNKSESREGFAWPKSL